MDSAQSSCDFSLGDSSEVFSPSLRIILASNDDKTFHDNGCPQIHSYCHSASTSNVHNYSQNKTIPHLRQRTLALLHHQTNIQPLRRKLHCLDKLELHQSLIDPNSKGQSSKQLPHIGIYPTWHHRRCRHQLLHISDHFQNQTRHQKM